MARSRMDERQMLRTLRDAIVGVRCTFSILSRAKNSIRKI